MGYLELLTTSLKGLFPFLLIWLVLPPLPFIVAERLWPVAQLPRFRDYGANILISITSAVLALPLGIAAYLWSTRLKGVLPWEPISFSFSDLGTVPIVGPAVEILAMIFVPLFLHDLWYYWAHRLEHAVPVLWQFHKLHHSDEQLNTSTWARDHFLQTSWRAFFS